MLVESFCENWNCGGKVKEEERKVRRRGKSERKEKGEWRIQAGRKASLMLLTGPWQLFSTSMFHVCRLPVVCFWPRRIEQLSGAVNLR